MGNVNQAQSVRAHAVLRGRSIGQNNFNHVWVYHGCVQSLLHDRHHGIISHRVTIEASSMHYICTIGIIYMILKTEVIVVEKCLYQSLSSALYCICQFVIFTTCILVVIYRSSVLLIKLIRQ